MRIAIVLAAAALALCACGQPRGRPDISPAEAKANLDAANAFLAENAKAPGVVTTASGLQYRIVTKGPADGPRPGPDDEVKVQYEGKLLNGKVFDSSFERGQPASFPLEGLVPAWVEALQLMQPGDEFTLWVPPKLGYGEEGAGADIPPNSLLIFRIQLIGVLKHPAMG